jgi:hypothetical protein
MREMRASETMICDRASFRRTGTLHVDRANW